MSPNDKLWTKQEVADYLHYKVRTMERVAKLPGFPAPARPGNPIVWRRGDIIAWCRRTNIDAEQAAFYKAARARKRVSAGADGGTVPTRKAGLAG
jgi:hypothetical protein